LDGGHDFAVYKIAGSGDLGPGFRSIPGPLVVPTDPAHGYPSDATIADFDGGRKLDLAVRAPIGHGAPPTTRVCPGTGDGTFGAAQSFATDSDSGRLTVVDLDGAGLLDLVNLNRGEQVVTIQLNTTPVTPPNNPPMCSNGSAAVFAGNALNGSVTCAD